jgi:thioredoxin 1
MALKRVTRAVNDEYCGRSAGRRDRPARGGEERTMETTKTVAATDATFDDEVLKSESLVLVDFWAPWCGPCRLVAPVLEEIAGENTGKVKVVKVNVDENPGVSQRYGIRSIPTMMFFKGGSQVDTLIGAAQKQHIQEKVDTHG